jgi:RNA polymerase sigma factor (sigma-70 family)
MAAGPDTLLRHLRQLVNPSAPDETTDAVLLREFISCHDERAFSTLVSRHGPLVFHVCRRVLGDAHDAEDAFQAAFLVLARKANSVHPREALAAWLHGVARRVALKARSARARRMRETPAAVLTAADPRPDPLAELSARELVGVLDEEVQRLPTVYRLPVLLCCLEGRSLEEAARHLGWTPGSVKGRLERGRARLHQRLLRRGLRLSAVLGAAEIARGTAVPASWIARTARNALEFGAGHVVNAEGIAPAVALATQTLRNLTASKVMPVAALLLATCLAAAGVVLHRTQTQLSGQDPHNVLSAIPPKDQKALLASGSPASDRSAPAQDEVSIDARGRVLDPAGKPAPGAKLYVGYSVHRLANDLMIDARFPQPDYPLRAASDANGQFSLKFRPAELNARWLDDTRPAVIAVADGYGPAWTEIEASSHEAELSLQLVEDCPLDGRILDANRQPVAGAKIQVQNLTSDSPEGMRRFLGGEITGWYPHTWIGAVPGQPPMTITDANGRFRLSGLGRDRLVSLAVEGPSLPRTGMMAVTRLNKPFPNPFQVEAGTFERVASSPRIIRGTVRDKATGKPLGGVELNVWRTDSSAVSDEQGRFEIADCPRAASYVIEAQDSTAQPYVAASVRVLDTGGPDPIPVSLELVKGIPLTGRVLDTVTSKALSTAVIDYFPLTSSMMHRDPTPVCGTPPSSTVLRADGTYRLHVLPGPGILAVRASPMDSYVLARPTDRDSTRLLGTDTYHALAGINPDANAKTLALDLMVQPARAVQGTLLGPNGQPLAGVMAVGLTARVHEEVLEGASFTITGLEPGRPRRLFFLHRSKGLGKVLTVHGDEAEPLTLHLEPCGSIAGRFLDRRGKPVPDVRVHFQNGEMSTDVLVKSDREGRFVAALPPGGEYTVRPLASRHLLRRVGELEVVSGRTTDLGDLALSD